MLGLEKKGFVVAVRTANWLVRPETALYDPAPCPGQNLYQCPRHFKA